MKPLFKLLLVTFTLFALSCSQNEKTKNTSILQDTIRPKNNQTTNNYFPFIISEKEEMTGFGMKFTISAFIENKELYPKYYNFFEKYGYTGNGPCWEGHIRQILEEIKPELLQHIIFDPEAGGFFAFSDTKSNQIKFVELLSPIFADLAKLEIYVKRADKSRIDD